jgi:transketolase
MQKEQIKHRRRIIELTKEADTTHIGSALSVVDIIDAIYRVKIPGEKFILSNGHAAAAWYVVLESNGYIKDPKINELGVHPERNPLIDIEMSTGSLGQGLSVAVGLALANRTKNVYCSVSDGECAEGSIWEAVSVASKYKLDNLKIVVNANGFAGYEEIHSDTLISKFHSFGCDVVDVDGHNIDEIIRGLTIETKTPLLVFARTTVNQLPFLKGLSAHYYKMTDDDYKLALETWSKD